jgi:hypothetical protein
MLKVFRDPNLSDRDLMLLVLYELARVRSEVKFIKEYISLDDSKKSPEQEDKLSEWCFNTAFDEMESDMLNFVRGKQNPEGN